MRCFAAAILWCISASAQPAAPTPADAPTPSVKREDKCAVEGTVVSATTGEPLKKTHLYLHPQPNGLPYGTTTDSAGHFVLDGIDPGRYSFSASRNGYITQDYSPKGDINHSTPLTLGSGQKLKDLVFQLTPQGVISGRVLDGDGEPLARVFVQLSSSVYWRGKRRLVGGEETSTNDLGEYRIFDLKPAKYVIGANYQPQDMPQERPAGSAVDAAEEAFVPTFYPNAMNPDGASLIEVTAGAQITGINLTLSRTRTISVKGHVTTGATAQWRRTSVMLLSRNDVVVTMSPPSARLNDPKGSFVLRGVTPGSYMLYAAAYMNEGKRYTARLPLEVGNSNIEGIEMTLQPPVEVHGRVIIEANGDLKGTAVNLQLQPRTPGGQFGGGVAQVKDDDLSFKWPNAGLDSYDLHVYLLPESFYLKAVRIGQQDVTETGIDLTQGVAPDDLTVVLNPNGGQIEGSVQNAKDEPAIGATVTLIPDAAHRSQAWLYKTANTDQSGRFVIKGVRPGDYKIYAWEEMEQDAYQDPDFVKPHESVGETVSIKEGARQTVQLKAIPAENTGNRNPER